VHAEPAKNQQVPVVVFRRPLVVVVTLICCFVMGV
jgi:hypothetical protein